MFKILPIILLIAIIDAYEFPTQSNEYTDSEISETADRFPYNELDTPYTSNQFTPGYGGTEAVNNIDSQYPQNGYRNGFGRTVIGDKFPSNSYDTSYQPNEYQPHSGSDNNYPNNNYDTRYKTDEYVPQFGRSGTNNNFPIGLISDINAEQLHKTLDFAISVANADLSVPLIGYQETINYGDSLQGYNRLCKLMQIGIGVILGPFAKQPAAHLMSVCDAKDIPYIYPHMGESSYSLNLYPHAADIAKALHDLISEFGWSRLIFLYESSEYLSIFDYLHSYFGSKSPVISLLRYDLKLNGNYKAVLRRVRKSMDNLIVVVGSTNSVKELLKQAQQVGIMNEDYKYIIGNLDLHTYNLEEYAYSEANITGMRLFSPEQDEVKNLLLQLQNEEEEITNLDGYCPITMEMALTYDAVQIIAQATKHIVLNLKSLDCSHKSDNVQLEGSTFMNYMRTLKLEENSISGNIFFEENIRKGYTFEIIELQSTGLVKVGTWNERENLTLDRMPKIEPPGDIGDNSLVNKTFRVLISVPNKPYASLVESHKKLDGNNQFEGFGIDLIIALADKLGFNYTFINGGNDYGSFNKTTNRTTGMLKEIVEGRADLAITDLTITSEREEAIDFSIPFMNLGIAILYIKPIIAPPALFSFMDPFSGEVWLYLGLAYLGVSLCFFVLGRLSHTEWDNPYPCIEEPDELENQFTINNSLWFTTGALLQQGSEVAPKALSTRTLASIWWFFTLIIVSSYTANLAAFLTIENPTSLLDNVEDLADNKGGVQYGAKRTGSTRTFFLTSEEEIYKKMNEYMVNNPQFLTETNQEGVDRVKSGTEYAFLMESTSIEYNTVRECNLMKIGEPLDEKGYGIAMIKNWPYRDKFNNALLELQESGVLAKIKNKWWNEVGAGVCDSKGGGDDDPALGLSNLGGVYFVLVVGSAFSIIFGVLSWCHMVISKSKFYDVKLTSALVEEFKTVVDFSNNELDLKSATSVYSRSRHSSISIDSVESDEEKSDKEHEPS